MLVEFRVKWKEEDAPFIPPETLQMVRHLITEVGWIAKARRRQYLCYIEADSEWEASRIYYELIHEFKCYGGGDLLRVPEKPRVLAEVPEHVYVRSNKVATF